MDPCLPLHTPQKSVGNSGKETDANQHQPPGRRHDHDALRTFEHFCNGLGHTFWSGQCARYSRGVPPCNLDSTTYGPSVERSSRELCKTLQCRRITYGDLPWKHVFRVHSRSKREHIGAEPGIVGKQSQHVPSPRRAGHQANHPRSIEARDSVCAHVHSTRLADWFSIEQN